MDQDHNTETLTVPASAKLSEAALVKVRAAAGKRCEACQSQRWLLTKRQFGGGWHRYLQCLTCGSSTTPSFRQSEHPNWETYPGFDAGFHDRWIAERQNATKAAQEADSARWWAKYDGWLANSPEWPKMRQRVMKRANGMCEACLEKPAEQVHHLTYGYGFLPPAYFLVAVCRVCHAHLHTEGDDWGPKPLPPDTSTAQCPDAEDLYDGEIDFD
jgi:hypothetical protein